MCLAMYLFTDIEIQEIEWDNNDPKLFIENIKSRKLSEKNALKWNENNGNIYYIGSSEGCGCGWRVIHEYDLNNMDDIDQKSIFNKIRDRIDLYNLLKLYDTKNSYIIVCWEGEQGEELAGEENINIESIKNINNNYYEIIKIIFDIECTQENLFEVIEKLDEKHIKYIDDINYEFKELVKYRLEK